MHAVKDQKIQEGGTMTMWSGRKTGKGFGILSAWIRLLILAGVLGLPEGVAALTLGSPEDLIVPNGRVGIGKTNPVDALDISGSINISDRYKMGGETVLYSNPTLPALFLGYRAGVNNTGSWNTFIGSYSGNRNTTGSLNTFVGPYSGYNNTMGEVNTFLGVFSGFSNTTGIQNTFLGAGSGFGSATGSHNSFIGWWAGAANVGSFNTYVGDGAGQLNETGSGNVIVGTQAGYNSTGQSNVFVGTGAGRRSTGSGNVFLGNVAGEFEAGSNKLYIDNNNTNQPLVYGEFDNDLLAVNGNLGIGSVRPQKKLHIVANPSDRQIRLEDPFGFWELWAGGNFHLVEDAQFDRIFVQGTTGNVGIGTASPQEKLDVTGAVLVGTGLPTRNAGSASIRLGADTANDDIEIGSTNRGITRVSLWNTGSRTFMDLDARKIKARGGVDPPYVSFTKESHESIREFAKSVDNTEAVMQFWNDKAHRMEYYDIKADTFYTMSGELVK